MKKLVCLLSLAVIVGLGLGGTATLVRLRLYPWSGDIVGGRRDDRLPPPADPEALPRVVVDQAEYDFGTMDYRDQGRHDFIFRNVGEGPLRLRVGNTTCRCTIGELESDQIPPGGTAKVTLVWHAEEMSGPYRQSATILTNDPAQPKVQLSVSGRITAAVFASPSVVQLGMLSPEESHTAEVELVCTLKEPLEVSYTLSDQSIAQFFQIDISPLDDERVKKHEDAQSGLLLGVTIKPGLPLGPFVQTIQLQTNVPAVPKLEITIKGTVAGDISIVGAGWLDSENLLTFGVVQSHEGASRRLLLVTCGPYRDKIKFKPVTRPSSPLRVTVGETIAIGDGKVTQTPLIIEIPKGASPVSHLGGTGGEYDEVVIQTTHPKSPQLRILVRYAVVGSIAASKTDD